MRLCVIPARGGSKRIPRKNIKFFCGQSMIGYPIKAALASKCFDKVIVSTDDQEIAQISKSFGAETPFMRPEKLGNDYVSTVPVVKHAIEWFDKKGQSPVDVCCLYATNPFLRSDTINKAYNQFKKTQLDFCFTVTSFVYPIQRSIQITTEGRVEMLFPENFGTRSQDLEDIYHDAGQIYWGRAEAFKQQKLLFSKDSSPFILPRYLVYDIDTLEDWKHAELIYQVLKRNGELD